MAEIKNSFLKSKMNKDLDDRLIPNGEYRDAQNISVGKSEADDIGALENVLGNTLVPDTDLGINNLEIIGHYEDDNSNTIYLFLTDNSANHFIYKYNNGNYTKLVEGTFLNFNTADPISGVNLVENLLFFTDNRNQPRKINVSKTLGYYTKENQISVAKYNPYDPITLLNKVTAVTTTNSSTATLLIADTTGIYKGMSAIQLGNIDFEADNYFYVTAVNTNTSVVLNAAPATVNAGEVIFIATTMTGKNITYDFNGGADWPGDPDFLESLFVRFSYRFKFDDKEYSLMAPFTQPAFIPQQKGYFLADNEDAAFRSTVLDFMQNGVQDVKLVIPLPDTQANLGDQNLNTYKITEIDILYKESDARTVKVLDTVNVDDLSENISTYTYNYQSRKPYKTLPERQTVRVYDRVPVKALTQEVAGNRVIYGNFQSQHTPPPSINYQVGASGKTPSAFDTWAEYPNHTLKQNRNYQVGFVLADKFGRQSSVILSSVDATTQTVSGTVFGGSTIYHPYTSSTQNLKEWFGDALKVVIDTPITSIAGQNGQPGLYADKIVNGFNVTGTPVVATNSTTSSDNTAGGNTNALVLVTGNANIIQGMTVTGGGLPQGVTIVTVIDSQNFVLSSVQNIPANSDLTYTKHTYTFTLAGGAPTTGIPVVNSYLRGEYTDFVKVTNVTGTAPYVVTTEDRVNEFLYSATTNNPDIKFAYNLNNPLGWYSYKIVVKQQEQDYYNCYFAGFLDGYPAHTGTSPYPTNEDGKTGHTVLINDNINKVPRDLSEVGPEQKQFRSSVRLYGRVNNTATDNVQFFPVNISGTQILPLHFTADAIATALDLNINYDELTAISQNNFYQLDTNPLITRLATLNSGTTTLGVLTGAFQTPFLSVAETEPVESALQLFYETSTAGLIADLNADIDTGFDGVAGLSALSYSQNEGMAASTDVTAMFKAQNNQGADIVNTSIESGYPILTITDGNGTTRATGNLVDGFIGDFKLITSGIGYKLQTNNNQFVFESDGATKEVYTIQLQWRTTTGDESTTTSVGSLDNIAPVFVAGSSLPDVTVSAAATAVVTRNGYNGSASNNANDLKYSITAGNSGGYFTYNSTTGAITKSGSTPIGVYTLTLKIEDAVLGGVPQTGSLSVTKTQQITVGADAVNGSVISSCKAQGFVSQGIPVIQQSIIPNTTTSGSSISAAWYISDNTYTRTDFNSLPSVNIPADNNDSNYVYKLGSALTQGTVVFQCNMQQTYSFGPGSGGPSFTNSYVEWIVYHRANSSGTWTQINDVNNSNIEADANLLNNSLGTTKYASTAFAFDQAGEYVVIAKDAYVEFGGAYSDSLCIWVNSNDLYYSTCVIEDGQNEVSTANPKYYKYDVSSFQSNYTCNTGSTPRYAPMPYAQYVDLFYTDTALASPWTSASVSGNFPNFLGFKVSTTSPKKPFDQVRVSAKFGTDGVKISGDNTTCTDTYARGCISGNASCPRPVPGDVNWS
jgi:hypothetical protein